MTRKQKLERIHRYRPTLYIILNKQVPGLVCNPDTATAEEVEIYNDLIAEVARLDHNNETFKKNFSF